MIRAMSTRVDHNLAVIWPAHLDRYQIKLHHRYGGIPFLRCGDI